MRPLIAALAVSFAVPAAASGSLEALGVAAGPIQLAPATPARPRPAPRAAEMLGFARGGYAFQSDAERALNEARNNLRAAGAAVLGAQITREPLGRQSWGFSLSYADSDRWSTRRVETYRSGVYRFSSDAENAMRASVAELRRAGIPVVLDTLIRTPGFDYYYEVDYLGRAGAPDREREGVVRSMPYRSLAECQRAMQLESRRLSAQGYAIIDQRVLHDGRSNQYFYQIRYARR